MEVVKAIEAVGGRARSKSPHAPAVTRQRRTRPSCPGRASLARGAGASDTGSRVLISLLTHVRTHLLPSTPGSQSGDTSKKVVVADCGEIAPSDPSFLDKD